jgi:hypothetical protein
MRSYIAKISILIFFTLIILGGCQQEVVEIINPPNGQVITPNSVVADLVEKTSLKDGSSDNILDHASCISLVLPVTVLVNGNEVIVSSEEDLKMIENMLDELEEENDAVLIFPVTVLLADYTEIIIPNQDELETLRDQCTEGGEDDDIECVDFKYPITCSIYDTENQISDVITVDSDKELHDLFDYIGEDTICSFDFPITLVQAGGEEIVIHNNDELENILKNAIGECDEEDDHYENEHHSDDDTDEENPTISSVIVKGFWIVAEYTEGDVEKTQNYDGFQWDFNTEGGVVASNGTDEVNGTWSTLNDSGSDYFVLDFGQTAPFDQFNEDWEIVEFHETKLVLRNVSGGDGSVGKLVFESI